ncbi:MAG: hypothetical protein AAF468_18795 [Pseudomonadota bacterium]
MVANVICVYATVFGAAAIVLHVFIGLLRDAAQSIGQHAVSIANRISIGLLIWPALAITYALLVGLNFISFIPVLIIPLAIGAALMFTPTVTEILSAISLHRLIGLGFYRVAGAIFLYCYYAAGTLSRGFALNAGWGDVLTGVLALPVAWMVWKKLPGAGLAIIVWCAIGVGDLILAPVSANLYGAERLVDFPLNLIPLFLGPPLGILLHLVTLRAGWLQRNQLTRRELEVLGNNFTG